MTYDLGGGNWKVTPSFNTPMTKVEQNLEKWNVFSPHKLCIGLASYGYKYTNLQLGERIKSISEIRKHSSYITYPAIIDSLKQAGEKNGITKSIYLIIYLLMVRVLSQQIILAPLNINYNGLLIGDIEAFFGGNFIMI